MPRNNASPVDTLTRAINDRFGEGTVKSADHPSLRITRLPTGILAIDLPLKGGFARGRHFEIFGSANVGKTAITYRLIAETQRNGGKCGFVDVEGTFDPEFAESLGVNLSTLRLVENGPTGNDLLDIMETWLLAAEEEPFDVIVLDSIAALLPKDEAEKSLSAGTMGTMQAKLMSTALRRLTRANRTTVLAYINQTRDSMSMFAKATTSGGRAMGFYAGTRLELVRTENLKKQAKGIDHKSGEEKSTATTYGHRILVRVEKDKTGVRPGDETTLVYNYDLGDFDAVEDLIYLGRRTGVIKKGGNKWWVEGYEDESQNGRPRFKRWLRQQPDTTRQEVEELIRDRAAALVGSEEETEPAE